MYVHMGNNRIRFLKAGVSVSGGRVSVSGFPGFSFRVQVSVSGSWVSVSCFLLEETETQQIWKLNPDFVETETRFGRN